MVLTFDDGYKDNIDNALPILKKYGFKATVYVITDSIGQDRYMNWDDLKNLKNNGWAIGSHTQTHPDLTQINIDNVKDQLERSKQTLEKKLKIKINDFCYPSGKYNDNIINEVKNTGYNDAVTTKPGSKNNIDHKYELNRIRINSDTSIDSFKVMMRI